MIDILCFTDLSWLIWFHLTKCPDTRAQHQLSIIPLGLDIVTIGALEMTFWTSSMARDDDRGPRATFECPPVTDWTLLITEPCLTLFARSVNVFRPGRAAALSQWLSWKVPSDSHQSTSKRRLTADCFLPRHSQALTSQMQRLSH